MLRNVIHNHKKILSGGTAENFENLIQEQTDKLQRFFKRYRKPVMLEVILSQDGRQYHLTLKINMSSGPLIVKRKAVELWPLTYEVFDILKNKITETLAMERKEHLHKKKKRQVKRFGELMGHLEGTHRDADRDTFEALLRTGIPGLRNYLKRRLHQVGYTGRPEYDALNVEDLVGELYVRVYDRFAEHPKEASDQLSWLYNMADSILEEKLKEKDLLETENLYHVPEQQDWQDPEMTFSVDAEGELTPIEELDDPVFIHNFYNVEDIFTDNPEEAEDIRREIDERMTREEFHHYVSSELTRQPFFKRSVFDLYIIDRFEPDEIAGIKKCEVDEVDNALREVRTFLKERIRSWIREDEPVSS